MSGPLTWWANRKSKIGLSPAAIKPPHEHGKAWWTTPPTMMPQPEHIEYVVQYQLEVMRRPPSHERTVLQGHIGAWLRAARQLLHDESYSPERADLVTTDGLLIAATDALHELISAYHRAGGKVSKSVMDTQHALERRCTKLRRERAIASSKTATSVAD